MNAVSQKNLLSLPAFSRNPCQQLNSLLLNSEQLEAIQHPSKTKLIIGGYGAGKSIIAEEIVKKKYLKAIQKNEQTEIFHVTWEPYSLVEVLKEKFVEGLKNDHLECNYDQVILNSGNAYRIWHEIGNSEKLLTLSSFLRYFKSKKVSQHVVIDEFPGDQFQESEVETMKTLFRPRFSKLFEMQDFP